MTDTDTDTDTESNTDEPTADRDTGRDKFPADPRSLTEVLDEPPSVLFIAYTLAENPSEKYSNTELAAATGMDERTVRFARGRLQSYGLLAEKADPTDARRKLYTINTDVLADLGVSEGEDAE